MNHDLDNLALRNQHGRRGVVAQRETKDKWQARADASLGRIADDERRGRCGLAHDPLLP
jgi:hypothetical protein